MAKDSSAKPDKKKRKKSATADIGGVRIKVKAGPKKGDRDKKKRKPGGSGKSGFDALAKLAEHPIVADLIAVGATAAVAALAERRGSAKTAQSANAAKAAGKAAAAAIGRRLMSEFESVKEAAAASSAKKKG